MLQSLRISNYAIINEAEILFSPSMNVITGETGAGKSILLGALSLVLGERADTRVLFDKQKKCVVEAVFKIGNYGLQHFFVQEDIDYADETVIRRELNDAGKSRAFINDTPVNLNILQQLADQLITVHSQHETLALGNASFQRTVVDALADHETQLEKFRKQYVEWKDCIASLKNAEELFNKAHSERDFISYQLEELNKTDLDNIDQAAIESELQQLLHAEEIKTGLLSAAELLNNGEHSTTHLTREVISLLRGLSKFDDAFNSYIERLESALEELRDVARDFDMKSERISADPRRAEELQSILDIIFKLQKKHGLQNVEELIALRNTLREQLAGYENSEEEINRLTKQRDLLHASLLILAKKISEKRKSVIPGLESAVTSLMSEVGMKDAVLKVEHNFDPDSALNEHGADHIRYLFSANKGSAPLDINKVASGGELSRLMLCIKSLLAKSVALPTLIFDEIDAGISGETANKVARILSRLSDNHQLIAITHLPQIASKGSHHLFVYKETGKTSTFTRIRLLNAKERVEEIAKMLSGANPTASALATAKELLQ